VAVPNLLVIVLSLILTSIVLLNVKTEDSVILVLVSASVT